MSVTDSYTQSQTRLHNSATALDAATAHWRRNAANAHLAAAGPPSGADRESPCGEGGTCSPAWPPLPVLLGCVLKKQDTKGGAPAGIPCICAYRAAWPRKGERQRYSTEAISRSVYTMTAYAFSAMPLDQTKIAELVNVLR